MASNSELVHTLAPIPIHGKCQICLPMVIQQIPTVITEFFTELAQLGSVAMVAWLTGIGVNGYFPSDA